MGIRLTKKRQEILNLLKKTKEALSAKEIGAALPHIDLVTIYRNLDLFVREKIITQLNFAGHDTKFEFQKRPHYHAVCGDCKKIIHFDIEDKKLKNVFSVKDFEVDGVELTIKGKCKKH